MTPTARFPTRCSVVLLLTMLGSACGWSSPENYYDRSAKLVCRYAKKCDKTAWNAAGFDNVGECVDETTSAAARKAFADACSDFDKEAARKCLAGARKAKRQCDLEAPSNEQEEACANVCGNPLDGE